jgi:hypothetical protein
MKIERLAPALLGVVAVCWLLTSTACNGGLTSNPGGTQVAFKSPGDWGMSLTAGGTVGIGQFPAKFTFDFTATPDCINDYVAFNTSRLGASGTAANIIAFNKLYSTQGSVGGLCAQNGPSVYWSYFTGATTGAGTTVTSVVLSWDGKKVAFVENVGTQAWLRILKWKAGENTGVAPTTTVAAGTTWNAAGCGSAGGGGSTSCLRSIAFNNVAIDTRSAPFYDYAHDALYVGDNAGVMHKFTPVFGDTGAPAEVTVGWPITVTAGAILTGPVYDSVSKNIFVGDSTGHLRFIKEAGSAVGTCAAGSAPCLGSVNLAVGAGGAVVDAPIVDGSLGMVYAVNGTDTTNIGTIVQADTALVSKFVGSIGQGAGGNTGTMPMYSGAFDNTYFTSTPGNTVGHLYVCGKTPNGTANNDIPAIYQLSFTAATGVVSSVGISRGGLVTDGIGDRACSPITEFYNPNGGGAGVARDWIFFSIGNNSAAASPIPAGSNCRTALIGCVISANVAGNPTWNATNPANFANAAAVPANNAGSTSGFVVDNMSTLVQASSFYFSLTSNSTGAGPGIPSCNTTAGVGCAVKLTQAGLN